MRTTIFFAIFIALAAVSCSRDNDRGPERAEDAASRRQSEATSKSVMPGEDPVAPPDTPDREAAPEIDLEAQPTPSHTIRVHEDNEALRESTGAALGPVSAHYVESIRIESISVGRLVPEVPFSLLQPEDANIIVVRAEVAVSGEIELADFTLSDERGEKGFFRGVAGQGEENRLQTFGLPPIFYNTGRIWKPAPGPVTLAYSIKSGIKEPLTISFRGARQEVELLSDIEWRISCLQRPEPAVRIAAAMTLGKKQEETTIILRALNEALEAEKDEKVSEAINEAMRSLKQQP